MIEASQLQSKLVEIIARTLNRVPSEINVDSDFPNLGMDSLAAMFVLDELEQTLQMEINPLLFWEHPTIRSFSAALAQSQATPSRS